MEFVGRNSICHLRSLLKGKICFFTQKDNFERFEGLLSGYLDGKDIRFYTAISSNPKREEIKAAQDEFKDIDFDVIVAFGGGSVIDFAKAFRFYDARKAQLLTIPTTAGTGSEATQFAVVYVDGVKTSLDDAAIRPDIAIVDSQFVENAPCYLKACCAMDAYCQAIESFWAKRATAESKQYALEAIRLCRDYLCTAVLSNDAEANEKMSIAAHLAGKAINISRTTAAHALSYKITSKYGIPHGHAVALNIAGLFEENLSYINEKEILLDAMGSKEGEIAAYFHNLMNRIHLEDSFEKLGICDLDEIVASVNVDRLNNNPKTLMKSDILRILQK